MANHGIHNDSGGQVAAPEEDLIDALAQTAFAVTAVLSRVGAEHDLSLTQLRVLAILRDRRLRMSDLATYLGLEKSTMSGLVDRAGKRGLLTRESNGTDGRAIDVLLTEHGRALAGRVFAEVTTSLQPLTAALAPAKQVQLEALLTTMLDATGDARATREN